MSNIINFLSTSEDRIKIEGVEALALVCNYNPIKEELFFHGLSLAEDLLSHEGVVLYTKGTDIGHDTLVRLIELKKRFPNFTLVFEVDRDKKFLDNYRKVIMSYFRKLIKNKSILSTYKDLMKVCSNGFHIHLKILLENKEVLLAIFKLFTIVKNQTNKNATLFFNHSMLCAIYCYGITQCRVFKSNFKLSNEDIVLLLQAALFHNCGALEKSENILKELDKHIFPKYLEASRESDFLVEDIGLDRDVEGTIRKVNDYFFDRRVFVEKEEKLADIFSNVLAVAIQFNRLDSGFLIDKLELSQTLDELNVQAMNGKLNKKVIQALTMACKFEDMFDFYNEIDRLTQMCPHQDSVPYPMTGMNSPTLFVCKTNRNECEHFEGSVKAVSIVTAIPKLEIGKYARCKENSNQLHVFYKEHYKAIKKEYDPKNILTDKV